MRVLLGVCAAAILAFVGQASAAPVDLKDVPADAKWLVHVDVDAIRQSTVVQKMWPKAMEMHPDAQKRIEKLLAETGMDIRKDLHGVTLYGKQLGKHEGVAIVRAKCEPKLLLEKAAAAPDHKVVEYGDYRIQTWTPKGCPKAKTAAGVFFKPDVLVFAKTADEVKAALDVLTGKTACAAKGSALDGRAFPGTTVLMRATGFADIDAPEKHKCVKQIKSLRVAMGENEGKSFFRARAEMDNEETAKQVTAIIEGGLAMAKLHTADKPDAKGLVDAVKIHGEGANIMVGWEASADHIWSFMEKHGKEMAEMHKKMEQKKHEKKEEKKACEGKCEKS